MQTILGANGTIGTLLARELKDYTNHIRLVSRNPVRVNDSDELFQADLNNPEIVEKAIEGSDVVYLVVGLDYNLDVWEDKWPKLMKATINACIKFKTRLVFFDNVYMYDINSIPHMTEKSAVNPPSKKGAVRKRLEQMIMNEVKSGRLMALIARSADFYGPNCKNGILNEMVYKNLKKGKAAIWVINAGKKHSFTFTPDAAKATALLGNTDDAYNQVWHLPTYKNTLTGKEFIDLFAKELNVKSKTMVMPLWMIKVLGFFMPLMRELTEMMYQYDRDYFFDSSKFDNKFSFKTTTYTEGVKLTVHG